MNTTIRISAEMRDWLASKRVIPQEPYDGVLRRLASGSMDYKPPEGGLKGPKAVSRAKKARNGS